MRCLVFAVCSTVILAADPNRLPQEEARRYARPCVEQAANLGDLPIKTDADPEKACAVRGEGGGAMIVPDKGLSADKLGKAGPDVTPVGQLWLRKWTPVVSGKATPDDRLRIVTVNLDDQNRPLPLLLLGVRRPAGKGPELVVYAKESAPLESLPLTRLDLVQELPLELEWQRGEQNVDSLTVRLLGKYQAVVPITRQGN